MKILYSWSTFIFVSTSSISWKIYVWTKLLWKFEFSISKKILDQHYGKIPNQEFKLWSTKYLKLKLKNKSWYIQVFFEPVRNNASSSSLFNATVIGYFDILILWYFNIFFNNCSRFLDRCSFHHIFYRASDKIFIENQITTKTNRLADS